MSADMDVSLADYRENRKLSLEVRDLVAAGRVDEARERAAEQVSSLIAKLSSDTTYRKEYQHLWAQQRRYAVSDLLPESSVAAQQAAASKPAAKGAPGKGGKASGPKPPPPKPNGKEKAASIIESLMAQASKEVEALQSRRAAHHAGEDSGDADDDVEPAPKASKATEPVAPFKPSASSSSTATAAPARLVADPAAAAASAFNFKVELPKVDEVDFTPLPVVRSSEDESPESKRAKMLEEQRVKAAEAEERKRRRAEQAERRRTQAAETAKRLEQERKDRDAAARAAAAQAKAAARDDSATEAAAAAAKAEAASKPGTPTLFEKKQLTAAAKRPKTKAPAPLRTANKVWQQYQAWIIFGIVMLLCILFSIMYILS